MTPVIMTEQLSKVFNGVPVVSDVNLQVSEGNIYGLVGPNGAGKSTLLKLLVGYIWPTKGTIQLFGEMLTKYSTAVREQMHLVNPHEDAFKTFRVDDVVKYYELLYPKFDTSRCTRLLHALELPTRARMRNLSLGMKTQLWLVVALSSHPRLLLLDEPTNGLDPVVKRQFLQLLVQEAAVDGTTILLATHHLDDLERIADGVAVMHRGRLIASDLLDTLKAQVKEVQFVFQGTLPSAIEEHPQIISCGQRGQFYSLVLEGLPDPIIEALKSAGAQHLEVVDLPFDELFRRLMEREGYTRESLLL